MDARTQTKPARPAPDWDRLTFSFSQTDVIYRAVGDAEREPVWEPGQYLPFEPLALSPAAAVFSYGIGVFEGLKAQRSPDGRVLVFRHRDNARRFQHSAERLVMPPFPEDGFVDAVEGIVRRNLRFVPPHGKGSFYIRPMQHGIEAQLGIRPSRGFWVLIYGCPVGSYFPSQPGGRPRGLRLRVVEQGRCAEGGTGSAKVIGNYSGGLAIAKRWREEGFDDVLYLDARHLRYLTETSGSNVFVRLKSGRLVTPALDDQILAGLTRDSVLQLAAELGVGIEERPIPVEEALADGQEIFCTGTAYTVWSVDELVHRDRPHRFPSRELQPVLLDRLQAIQRGEREDPFGWVTEVRDTED